MSVTDTGWKKIIATGGDGEHSASGKIEMVRGSESRPCMMCKSWEKDEKRLIQHLLSIGLEAQPDGCFVTPIAKDIPGRKSMRLDPKQFGFCRLESTVTQDLASCPSWQQVRLVDDLRSRIKR